jgi:hypothetical protein
MGCLARLGCLILLVVLGVCAWVTRAMWLPDRFREHPTTERGWQPLTDAGAARTRTALEKLSQTRGPVYQTLSAGDVASLVFSEAAKRANGAVDSVAARIDGDRMTMRARVATVALRDKLGPLVGVLNQYETVQLTGTFTMLQPGLGEFTVEQASIGKVTIPRGMISRFVQQIDTRPRPEGLAANALPLPVPTYVSDIRIANGKVTLYKNVK